MEFWNDLGLIFKNIKKHYKEGSSIQKMGDILKELVYYLYWDWYSK